MNVVAITACPTGIAHTYMAAEALERAGRAGGHSVRVETQGSMGVESALTSAEVAAADVVILAADIEVEGRERFEGKKVVRVSVSEAIKDARGVLARALG